MNQKLFADVATVLIHTKTAFPRKVTPAKVRLLREVADVLLTAETVSRAAGPTQHIRAWQKFWKEVADTRRTILTVALRHEATTAEVAFAANLLVRIVGADRVVKHHPSLAASL